MDSPHTPNSPSSGSESNDSKVLIEQMRDHMGSLGYEIKDAITGDKNDFFALSEEMSDFSVILKKRFLILIACYPMKIPCEANKKELLTILNEINTTAIFSRWYYECDEEGLATIYIAANTFVHCWSVFPALVEQLEEEIREHIKLFHPLERSEAS